MRWKLALNTAYSRGKEEWKEAGGFGWNLGLFFFLSFSLLVCKLGLCSHCCVLQRVWPHNAIKTNHRKERN